MLAIRMQRTGRRGHAQFRLVVQDSRFSPTSGRVVAYLGSYNPHTKVAIVDKDKAAKYLQNGARPSDTAAGLLKKEGVKLPAWVRISPPQKRTTRHPEKLKRNRPAEEKSAEAQVTEETAAVEEPVEEPAEAETESTKPEPESVEAEQQVEVDKEKPDPKDS